ncbi:MAG: porin, partial [Fimbriiglobus sp.]
GAAAPNVPFFVDTGFVPTDWHQELAGEVLWVRGPLSVQAEYIYMPLWTTSAGTRSFHGCYAFASWFLTGEHRPYRRDNGTLDRVIPDRDAVNTEDGKRFATGHGAWEVAVRLSHIDLDDGPTRGGRLTDLTVGVNWYLNPFLRVTANYIRAFLAPATAADGTADVFGVRVGYDF